MLMSKQWVVIGEIKIFGKIHMIDFSNW